MKSEEFLTYTYYDYYLYLYFIIFIYLLVFTNKSCIYILIILINQLNILHNDLNIDELYKLLTLNRFNCMKHI